jgi:hypothetical protein
MDMVERLEASLASDGQTHIGYSGNQNYRSGSDKSIVREVQMVVCIEPGRIAVDQLQKCLKSVPLTSSVAASASSWV